MSSTMWRMTCHVVQGPAEQGRSGDDRIMPVKDTHTTLVVGSPTPFALPPVDPDEIARALADIRINHEPLEKAVPRVSNRFTDKPYDEMNLLEKVSAVAVSFGPSRVGDLGMICRVFEMVCKGGRTRRNLRS